MGGGLVLFGIGGNVSGGLLDAFKGERRRQRQRGRGEADRRKPRSGSRPTRATRRALKALVRDNYSLAVSQQRVRRHRAFPDDAKDELRQAAAYWQRYLEADTGQAGPLARLGGAARVRRGRAEQAEGRRPGDDDHRRRLRTTSSPTCSSSSTPRSPATSARRISRRKRRWTSRRRTSRRRSRSRPAEQLRRRPPSSSRRPADVPFGARRQDAGDTSTNRGEA